MSAPSETEPGSWLEFIRAPVGRLALGLFFIQLLVAIQVFTTATILPTVAADLDGRHLYGAAIAATVASALLTMPVGGSLMVRYGVSRVLTWLAPLFAVGAIVSSAAPSMEVFVAGRVIQGLASGALSTVTLGAIVAAIPAQWRPRMFAMISAMWILPALFGPSYAALVVSTWSWRWALVLLIPPLLLARLHLARQIAKVEIEPKGSDRPLRLGTAAIVAAAVTLIVVGGTGTTLGVAVAVVGIAVALLASRRILPTGVFSARRERPSGILALFLLSLGYFGADDVVAIVVSDVLGGTISTAGATLSVGALGWAAASLAHEGISRRLRLGSGGMIRLGSVFLMVAFGLFALLVNAEASPGTAILAPFVWAVGGIGMGTAYPVLLNRILHEEDDGIDTGLAASSTVLSEALGAAIGGAVAGAVVSAWVTTNAYATVHLTALFIGFALVAFALFILSERIGTIPVPDPKPASGGF